MWDRAGLLALVSRGRLACRHHEVQAQDYVSVDLNDAPVGVPKDQMVDGKRELPAATGIIDVKPFLAALREIGFAGPVRCEPFNEVVRKMAPEEAAAAASAALKKAGL